MPIETRSNNALFRRAEQLKRWEDSETNKVSSEIPPHKKSKIKFSDGCIFLAACAASDTEEVERLLEQGADINTANVDGLTALHQACIDDNLDMVQFLVEHGCDVNQGDNEGWTPLHATASCGFVSIAKYLIEHDADVAAVNNDGDLPIDIAESPKMEELLSDVLDEKGIDCDEARCEEERIMLDDANQWLNGQKYQDHIHNRTGASALHVAAAKGYIKVMNILIKAGADLNVQDNDGWTPLHAASHWAQKEACAIMADNLANMDIQNFAGQTCFDVAESDLVNLLEELKKKQASMQKDRPEIQAILQRTSTRPPLKRRTSVTRMSGQEKSKSVMKDTKSERAQIEQLTLPEEEDDDKEKKPNEMGKENAVKQEVKVLDEEMPVIAKTAELEETVQRPPIDRIPSWKKMLRRSSENLIEDVQVAEEPEVVLKKPKNAESPLEEKSPNIESSNGPVNELGGRERSFIPPARDEESELQRKAHAKRVRETRRSTQGVLLEDVKIAELQYIIKTTQKARDSQQDDEDDEKTDDQNDKNDDMKSDRLSASDGNVTDAKQKEEGAKKPKPDNLEISAHVSDVSKSSIPSSPDTSPSVTLVLRVKPTTNSDEQSSPDSRTALGTPAAIQRRRRPKRRSTGVVYLDSDDALEEKENGDRNKSSNKEKTQEGKEQKEGISDRIRNRYGFPDASSEASSRSETPSRYSSLSCSKGSLNDESEKDYKKLYEDIKKENERLKDLDKENEQLRETLKKTEEDLEKTRKLMRKMSDTSNSRNSVSEAEKKERRALERKLSEMEEEVKQIDKLRADNERLKDENGALIRVISKLSK